MILLLYYNNVVLWVFIIIQRLELNIEHKFTFSLVHCKLPQIANN